MLITRQKIIEMLLDWKMGKISTQQLWDWANDVYLPGEIDFDDWEDEESASAANEVLAQLDNLDMNLCLPEDVPLHLEFLTIPHGEFTVGYAKWKQGLGSIDWKARRRELVGQPIYGPFCKP